MSNEVGSCCVSVCNFQPAPFAYCNLFCVDRCIVFVHERNYLWYHFNLIYQFIGSKGVEGPTKIVCINNFKIMGEPQRQNSVLRP